MSKNSDTPKKRKNQHFFDDYQSDLGAMEMIHASFDEKEKILMSQPIDQITKKETRSKVSDVTLLSATLKQNNSIMAQMPTGKVTALTVKNKGKSLFMDLILHNHVLPHANSQHDVFTKLWMLSFYRKVYGSMGALVDFVQGKNGYIGPDFTILPARSIIPQSGKVTVEDSDYTYVRSSVSRRWLETRDMKTWKNVDKVLEGQGEATDLNSQSYVERQHDGAQITKDKFDLITRYEPDRWVTMHYTTRQVVREIKNPQGNDQIPVIMCHAYPLLDRFFGLGDFERGATLHAAVGSLINLYLDGVKMSIFPPFKIDPKYIDNWDDFKDGMGPGQIWLMKRTFFDAIEQMQVNPSGIQSFQSTYGFLKAAILTLTNTSDTSVSQATDPGFGRTPQALKMQAFSQGMQTQFDRRMLELSTEKVFDRMIDLIAKKQEKPMKMYLKAADLERVKEVAPDVVEMFEVGDMGKVTIKPQQINNVDYRYEIDQGSTTKKDEIMENQALTDILGFIVKIPGAMDKLAQGGTIQLGTKVVDLGELFKRWIISSGVTDWDKIIIENEQGKNVLNMENPQVQEAMQGAFNQQPVAGQPQPPMNGQPMAPQNPMSPMAVQGFQDPAVSAAFEELAALGQAQ